MEGSCPGPALPGVLTGLPPGGALLLRLSGGGDSAAWLTESDGRPSARPRSLN